MTERAESILGPGARARKPIGVARVRQPVRDAERLWRGRYVDLDGIVRQAGRFERKGDAVAHTAELVARLNREGRRASSVPPLVEVSRGVAAAVSATSTDPGDEYRANPPLRAAAVARAWRGSDG